MAMASLEDLPWTTRLFIKTYPFRTIPWAQSTTLEKPLSQCKVAIVTTAAFFLKHQTPFDEKEKGGDTSFRTIASNQYRGNLRIGHRSSSFDHRGIEADSELALPIARLQELTQSGVIGAVADNHYSFMGSITAPGRLIKHRIPQLLSELKKEKIDVLLLTPV